MTTTTLPNRYQINGLVDTNNSVLNNMETIATTAGSLISFDTATGKWNVVILKTESVTRAFDDSNIIGGISVTGAGLNELYNSVQVQFPLRDTADEIDFVRVAVSEADRNPNEPDNELIIDLPFCNEPVQATIIGLQELKQNRADTIVEFTADYTASDVAPGDVISITASMYGWSAKQFRVITIERVEDAAITYNITAQLYDADVYSTADLERYVRSDRNGILAAGAIGTPNTPQIYDTSNASRPKLLLETVVPSGRVEEMEYWLSTDGTNYNLVGREKPVGGGVFSAGTTVTFDYDKVASGDFYVKTRGMNSTTTGPFSAVATLSAYAPVQTTDAIGSSTDVVDDSFSSVLGLLGANGLLALLKGFFEDDETGTNSVTGTSSLYEQFNAITSSTSGISITESLNSTMLWNQGYFINDNTGPWTTETVIDTTTNVELAANGVLLFVVASFNFYSTGTGSVDSYKYAKVEIYQNDVLIDARQTSSRFQDKYDDFVLVGNIIDDFSVGDDIKMKFSVETNSADGVLIDALIFQPYSSVIA